MATIVNRGKGKSRNVVYYYKDKDTNEIRQKWETYPSYEEAKNGKRKLKMRRRRVHLLCQILRL